MNNDELMKKKKYFSDSVYLKYEQQKIIKQGKTKKKYKLNKLQKVAAIIIVASLGLTVYAGVTGNIRLQEMGLLKLSQNYEDNLVEINKTIENEYCKITLENMAGDSAYIVSQYTINLSDKAIEKYGTIEYNNDLGYNSSLILLEDVKINSQNIDNIMSYVDKIDENKYTYTQVINIMNINDTNFLNLEINLKSLHIGGYSFGEDEIKIDKTIKSEIEIDSNRKTQGIILEQNIDENTKFIVEEIANTKFETFIRVKLVSDRITWEKYNENPLEYISFLLEDEKNNQVPCTIYNGDWAGKNIYVNSIKINSDEQLNKIKAKDIVKVEENYIIIIGQEEKCERVKVIPIKTRIYNDRNNEEETAYNNAIWYPVVEGNREYIQKSELGGILKINNININQEGIIFDYEQEGLIGNEWLVLIRKKDDIMNYIFPTITERKGINSNMNRIIFPVETNERAGLSVHIFNNLLDDIENLEFTLLFGNINEKIGEIFELNIPEQNQETANINNLLIIDNY